MSKMRQVLFLMLLALLLVSCGNNGLDVEKLRNAEVLNGPALDAVDLAIAISILNNQNDLHPEISMDLRQRLAKYNGNTHFEFTGDKFETKPVKKWGFFGLSGVKIVLLPQSLFRCAFKGALNGVISFQDGAVGVVNGEIYVKKGTKLTLNNTSFVFFEGKWRRAG
jgi:hypothetical protein